MAGAPLVIAIPSKGRIEEDSHALFARGGVPITKSGGVRGYSGTIKGHPDIEVRFLSSGEIAGALEDGQAHLGITGLDLLRDRTRSPDTTVSVLLPLGFGPANVVVAVPRAWIDVAIMADLADAAALFRQRHHRAMRVATKYTRLARGFFARHGVIDYRLVESAGATEAAPSNGQAELIVDITTTGATLKANGLKIPEDGLILQSEAVLAASLTAEWSKRARAALAPVLAALTPDTMPTSAKPKPVKRSASAAALFAKLT